MVGLVLVMALYPALVGYVATRWLSRSAAGALLVSWPALFVVAEWLRGWLFTGFGWLSPGYAQTESWLLGFAPIFGVLGVSWAVFALAGVLAQSIVARGRGRAPAAALAVLIVGCGWLTDRIAWTERAGATLSVALVQGAVPQEQKWQAEQLPVTMNLYRELTFDALGSDLIVWPEAAVPQYYQSLSEYLAEIQTAAARTGSEVVAPISLSV